MKSRLVGLTLALALPSCVGPPAGDSERVKLSAYVLDEAPPASGEKLDVDFDGKATLLGAKVEPSGVVRPGQRVKLTLFWQSKAALGDGWGLFTHVLDDSGERVLNADNVGPLRRWVHGRQVLGPWAWEPGKVYVDAQEITIPDGVRTSTIQIVTGIWKGNERLPTRSDAGARERRAIVATLATGVGGRHKPSSTRVPKLTVGQIEEAQRITIDGKLDEAVWAQATSTGPFRNVATGEVNARADLGGEARLLRGEDALYVAFTVTDTNVVGGFDPKHVDPHLWTRDTVELMIDPDGDGDNVDYYEIQINPQGLVFDSRFDHYNQPRVEPDGPFGHQEWSAQLTSAVLVNGTLDDPRDRDAGYTVEARIPWGAFAKAKRSPPAPGDEWRMNFYAMQDNGGVAWSPVLGQGNFHKASRFGRVVWGTAASMGPSVAASAAAGARVPPRLAPHR